MSRRRLGTSSLIQCGILSLGVFLATPLALAAQTPADYQRAVNTAYDRYKSLQEGKNADYIPALAHVDPNLFGVALVTPDGKIYTAGNVTGEVSIQSV